MLFTAVTGVIGGALFVIEPSGDLLGADPTVLGPTPFSDWFWPGMLLGIVVGLGFLVTAIWLWQYGWGANELSIFAGVGLIAFVLVEFAMIGFNALQALFAIIGIAVVALGTMASTTSARRRHQVSPLGAPSARGD